MPPSRFCYRGSHVERSRILALYVGSGWSLRCERARLVNRRPDTRSPEAVAMTVAASRHLSQADPGATKGTSKDHGTRPAATEISGVHCRDDHRREPHPDR